VYIAPIGLQFALNKYKYEMQNKYVLYMLLFIAFISIMILKPYWC